MATPETRVKEKLNRRDLKIAKAADLAYRRLTFGPFAANGLPDRWVWFGTASVAVEVKREGKKVTPLQQHKLDEMETHGIPAMEVSGDTGVDSYYADLQKFFTEAAVEERMIQYDRDCLAVWEALEELKGES